MRRTIELEAENEDLKSKIRVLEELLNKSHSDKNEKKTKAGKSVIHIADNDVLRFTELTENLMLEKNKVEQEQQKNTILDSENKKLRERLDRITGGDTANPYNEYDSRRSEAAENSISDPGHFVSKGSSPVGVGVKDLESFLEDRLLKELDIENRRLEQQLRQENQNVDVKALREKQSRLQEMSREVRQHQGKPQQRSNRIVRTIRNNRKTKLSFPPTPEGRKDNNDSFIEEFNRVRSMVHGGSFHV